MGNIVFVKTQHSHVMSFFFKADLVSNLAECTSTMEFFFFFILILYGHLWSIFYRVKVSILFYHEIYVLIAMKSVLK